MNSNPLVSVVVPVYNVQVELPRCVKSILEQTYANLNIILVDDGSTDESGRLCDSFAAMDNRVRVIHKENGGLSSARNAGLCAAKGDWLLYVDADDEIAHDACAGFVHAARRSTADFILGDAVHDMPGHREKMLHDCLAPGQDYPARDCIIRLVEHRQFFAPACFAMYRVGFLRDNGLYFVDGLLHEDMEMQPRVFLAATAIAYTGRVFYHYIDRSASIMNAGKREKRRRAMGDVYAGWKRKFDQIEDDELRKALYGHLAKCYLRSCIDLGPIDLRGKGITARFLFNNGLDAKEKAKACIFALSPRAWSVIGRALS